MALAHAHRTIVVPVMSTIVDEADTFLLTNLGLWSVINSGLIRATAFVTPAGRSSSVADVA